jgi:hypothetical protein
MWTPDCGYEEPVITTFREGCIHLAGFDIIAAEGPQGALFVAAKSWKSGKNRNWVRHFAGIGCYGWDNPINRMVLAMGVDTSKWKVEGQFSQHGPSGSFIGLHCSSRKNGKWKEFKIPEKGNKRLEARYIGIQPATVRAFRRWLKGLDDFFPLYQDKVWLEKVCKAEPLRYNQGDAWIGGVLKQHWGGTLPGKPQKPFLISAMKDKPLL